MRNPKVLALGAILVVLVGIVTWRWISNWGLVTCDFREVPLAKVIKSIEWQGGVTIVTNADLKKPTTLVLDHVPAVEAVDTLALRMDADSKLAFVAAPTSKQIKEVLVAFSANTNPGGWSVFSAGWGGGGPGGGGFSDTPVDPFKLTWKVSEASDKNLQTLLDQGAQKTGALFAVPKEWNPVLSSLPSSGKLTKVTKSLISKANGTLQEIFLVTVHGDRGENRRPEPTVFSPAWDGRRSGGNQDWASERVSAQIATLPPEERADAQKQVDEMKALFDSVRNLPEDQRRAKFEEVMNRPDVQEKMQERMESRDAKRTPAQREARYRNYIQRKAAAQGGAGAPARS
ncbi:hypothetical protein BH09VER1_BH09VER1_19030 [soil metagenome]